MNSPGKLLWPLSGFCSLLFRFFVRSLCSRCYFSGVGVYFFCSFEPFTTRPMFGFYLLVFFFLYGLFVDAVSLSVSLSLRRWGNPNLFGLGFPLCFFDLDALSDIDPYIFPYSYTKVPPPHLFFVFLAVVRAGSFLRFWFSGGVAVRVLFSGVWWSWFGLRCSLALLHLSCFRKTALPGTRPQRRLPPFPPPIGLSGVTRLLLGVVPWTGRSVAGWECRRLCDPATSRMFTTIITIVRPGHRRPPPNRPRPFRQCRGLLGVSVFGLQRNIRGRIHFPRVFIPLKSCIFLARVLGPSSGRQPYCHTSLVSPFSKGEMLSIFSFCVFCVWFGVFCRFFSVLLFLGLPFGKIFGSELLFLGLGIGRVYSGAVLPMFLLYYLVFRSRNYLEKILFWSGPFVESIFECELLFLATVLSRFSRPPSRRGKCCPFFSFCVFAGSASFVVFLPFFFSEGCFLEKFSGANFCFWVSVWVLRVLVLFCLCFCFIICFFAPETVLKNSIDVRSGVFLVVFFFPLVFSPTSSSFCVFFKRDSSGSNRAHPHTHLFCLSLFLCCPAAFACSPFLAVRPASWCFPWGAILGPTRFWDSPGTLLRPFLWTRGGKGVLVASFCCFRFPLLLCFAAVFTRARRGGPVIVRGIPPGHRTRPAPE